MPPDPTDDGVAVANPFVEDTIEARLYDEVVQLQALQAVGPAKSLGRLLTTSPIWAVSQAIRCPTVGLTAAWVDVGIPEDTDLVTARRFAGWSLSSP